MNRVLLCSGLMIVSTKGMKPSNLPSTPPKRPKSLCWPMGLASQWYSHMEYTIATEHLCQKFNHQEAMEFRLYIYKFLKRSLPLCLTSPKLQSKAIIKLKWDKGMIILTADKGVAMVVMDRQEYIRKAKQLKEQATSRPIPSHPSYKYRTRLINIIRRIKAETNIDENTYRRMYPSGSSSRNFHGLPIIHKNDTFIRPIVSSWGLVIFRVAKELARIFKPLVWKSPCHINNRKDFTEKIKKITLEIGECITSYNATALFTLTPVEPPINIIQHRLNKIQNFNKGPH